MTHKTYFWVTHNLEPNRSNIWYLLKGPQKALGYLDALGCFFFKAIQMLINLIADINEGTICYLRKSIVIGGALV